MSNFLDYLKWRGDLSFARDPFNEVDNLVLSELAYIDFSPVTGEPGNGVTLREAYRIMSEGNIKTELNLSHDPWPLLEAAAGTERFGNIICDYYINIIDQETTMQFSSTVFILGEMNSFVAFRGTDDTLVGWREDFLTYYQSQNAGQTESVEYLNHIMSELDGDVILGGHSKGGNLAIFGGAFCDEGYRKRIRRIYSNDGPGFNDSVTNTSEYRDVLEKVELIIPESSIISLILSNKPDRVIIQSSVNGGVQQHNPYTWEVEGSKFVRADEQSKDSIFVDEHLTRWVDSMDMKEKEHLVTAFFDAMESTGAETLGELPDGKLKMNIALHRAMKKMDITVQEDVKNALKKFASSYLEVKKEEKKHGALHFRNNIVI